MRRLFFTTLLFAGCGVASPSSSARHESSTPYPELPAPTYEPPKVTLCKSPNRLVVSDPFQGEILVISDDGSIFLRGTKIGQDQVLAESLYEAFLISNKQNDLRQ